MKKLTNREKVMTGVIIVLLLLFVGASYAWLSLTLLGQKTHVLHVAGLEITLDESMSEGIDIQKAFPITDEEVELTLLSVVGENPNRLLDQIGRAHV